MTARRKAATALLGAAVLLPVLVGLPGASAVQQKIPHSPHLPGAPRCGPSIAPKDAPQNGNTPPPQAPSYFAADFPKIRDSRLGLPVGGFGGERFRAPLHHTPVVFVHGNQADAQNWLAVMLQFQNLAHYSMQEMYAISYNGLGNFYAGMPTGTPTAPDEAYFNQNTDGFANGGHGAADDDEVPDVCRFIEAVQWYTGSRKVDIVTHSLGVTIVRETMRLYPGLAKDVAAFVGIAGGNHGTTVCRGLDTTYYGCDEIAPDTPWLARLNGPDGRDETYGPTKWMTIYNGSEGDPFFAGPDERSPVLKGADNRTFTGDYHNTLRVAPAEVDTYLAFLLRVGQAGPGAAEKTSALAHQIESQQPDGRDGELCGVKRLSGC